MTSSPILLALRVLSVPVTVAIVLVGIWVTGGAITNDFELAMRLTALWLGAAGLAVLAIGVKSRPFRWPVIGAYVITAIVVGVYLGRSVFFDKTVNEQVAMVAPAPVASAAGEEPAEPRNVLLGSGSLEPVRHAAQGRAQAIELAQGGRVVTLTNFEVDNGPDLRVYLVAGPALTEGDVDDFVDLGGLKGNRGNQQYEVPGEADLDRYSTLVIWCRAFSVLFARAPLDA
jgi:prepilin signal peptidase PulO-like enzyme (type II secretory pathway)